MTKTAQNTLIASYASAAYFAAVKVTERVGVIIRRTEYANPELPPVHTPLINTRYLPRVAFLVRLDGGIGEDFVTIDQTLDAVAALIKEGDQVSVHIVDDVHIESTVSNIFPYGSADDLARSAVEDGEVLRRGDFVDSKGVPSVASLILSGAKGSSGRELVIDVQAK